MAFISSTMVSAIKRYIPVQQSREKSRAGVPGVNKNEKKETEEEVEEEEELGTGMKKWKTLSLYSLVFVPPARITSSS